MCDTDKIILYATKLYVTELCGQVVCHRVVCGNVVCERAAWDRVLCDNAVCDSVCVCVFFSCAPMGMESSTHLFIPTCTYWSIWTRAVELAAPKPVPCVVAAALH